MTNILKLIHVNKSSGQNVVFQDVNCSIDSGHIVGLIGPNGSGKTVLLNMIAGVTSSYDGIILVNAQSPSFNTNRFVAYMAEGNYLCDFTTIQQAIDSYESFFEDFDPHRAHDLVFRFGLQPEQKISSLSSGMLQRVKFLLTMSRNVPLYLLDDPFKGVDPSAQAAFIEIILNAYSPDTTVLLTSQSIKCCESILDTILVLGNGKIMFEDNADRMRLKTKKSIEQFFTEVFKC